MNWYIKVENKAGLTTNIGYTHKTKNQIDAICKNLAKDGIKIIKVVQR